MDWSYTFKDGDLIKLPFDDKRLSYVGKLTISLQVVLQIEGEKLHFKVFECT